MNELHRPRPRLFARHACGALALLTLVAACSSDDEALAPLAPAGTAGNGGAAGSGGGASPGGASGAGGVSGGGGEDAGGTGGTGPGGASGSGGDGGIASACPTDVDEVTVPRLHTPRWAFMPWISKDISTRDDTYAFVKGFADRDIPVGVVVLDSPWESNYNSFVPHPSQYHDFPKLVDDLHAEDVRIVLWITQMVNTQSFDLEPGGNVYSGASPNYAEARDCNYFLQGGKTYTWWKGKGSALDFYNEHASTWWHRQMDQVLDVGVDGFKCDFGESYITNDPVETVSGPVPLQQYSEAYYRDFYSYGVRKRGPEDFVTMVRPYDKSYQFAGRFFARKEHAPVTWVGDNRRDWVGLADALDEIFISARAGYLVIGSDVGGYLDRDDVDILGPTIPFDTLVFARWTAVGALSPFMQLHGRANISPWTVPDHVDETVALYRYWSKFHQALVPFFASLVAEAEDHGAAPPIRPEGEESTWTGDFRFQLGDAFLVAPLLDATSMRDVVLPAGARFYDFWDDAHAPYDGGTTLAGYALPDRAKIPLFLREGAIVPLEVSDDANGLGTAASKGALTVLVVPGAMPSSFPVHEADGSIVTIAAKTDAAGVTLDVGASRAVYLRVRTESAPSGVTLGGTALPPRTSRADLDGGAQGYWSDAAHHAVWVKLPAAAAARKIVLAP